MNEENKELSRSGLLGSAVVMFVQEVGAAANDRTRNQATRCFSRLMTVPVSPGDFSIACVVKSP
jgi:hypothetical protein